MAKYLFRKDDDHFIIEDEDEYNKRTGAKEKAGCLGLFVLAIILSIQALCCDDKKKEPSQDKTEVVTTKQESSTTNTYQNVENY